MSRKLTFGGKGKPNKGDKEMMDAAAAITDELGELSDSEEEHMPKRSSSGTSGGTPILEDSKPSEPTNASRPAFKRINSFKNAYLPSPAPKIPSNSGRLGSSVAPEPEVLPSMPQELDSPNNAEPKLPKENSPDNGSKNVALPKPKAPKESSPNNAIKSAVPSDQKLPNEEQKSSPAAPEPEVLPSTPQESDSPNSAEPKLPKENSPNNGTKSVAPPKPKVPKESSPNNATKSAMPSDPKSPKKGQKSSASEESTPTGQGDTGKQYVLTITLKESEENGKKPRMVVIGHGEGDNGVEMGDNLETCVILKHVMQAMKNPGDYDLSYFMNMGK
jgi:hypothetical protein